MRQGGQRLRPAARVHMRVRVCVCTDTHFLTLRRGLGTSPAAAHVSQEQTGRARTKRAWDPIPREALAG